jgi:hypothetical protein
MAAPHPQPVSWVRYRPRDMRLRLARTSPQASLAHRELCDLVWSGEPWPSAAPEAAALLLGLTLPRWGRVWPELQLVGWRVERRRLFNPEVAAVLREAQGFLDHWSTAGRRGASETNRKYGSSGAAATPQQPSSDAAAPPQQRRSNAAPIKH